jgi:DNA-binding MarR family transcriptional regulator
MVEAKARPTSKDGKRDNDSLTRQLTLAAARREGWIGINGLVRAMTRPMLDAAVSMRHESLAPYERALSFAAERLAHELKGDSPHKDPRYLLGRLDALLDLCDMAIDRSVSEALLAQVRTRSYARHILWHLMQREEIRATELARLVNIKPNYLSNILSWMESVDLVRRVSAGRLTLVSIGPTGEAVYFALIDEPADWATSEEISEENRYAAGEVQEQLASRLMSQVDQEWAKANHVEAVSSPAGSELALAA